MSWAACSTESPRQHERAHCAILSRRLDTSPALPAQARRRRIWAWSQLEVGQRHAVGPAHAHSPHPYPTDLRAVRDTSRHWTRDVCRRPHGAPAVDDTAVDAHAVRRHRVTTRRRRPRRGTRPLCM